MGIFVNYEGALRELNDVYVPVAHMREIYVNDSGSLRRVYVKLFPGDIYFIRNDQITSSTMYQIEYPGRYKIQVVGNGGSGGSGGASSGWTYGGGGGSGGTGAYVYVECELTSQNYIIIDRSSDATTITLYDGEGNLLGSGVASDGLPGGDGEDAYPSYNPSNGGGGSGGTSVAQFPNMISGKASGSSGNGGNRFHGGDANSPPNYPVLTPQYVASQKESAYSDYEIPGVVLGNAGGGGHGGWSGDRGPGGSGAYGGVVISLLE